MEINISQSYVNERIARERDWQENTPEGKEWAKGCKEALKQWDYNGDGKTSAIEMYKD